MTLDLSLPQTPKAMKAGIGSLFLRLLISLREVASINAQEKSALHQDPVAQHKAHGSFCPVPFQEVPPSLHPETPCPKEAWDLAAHKPLPSQISKRLGSGFFFISIKGPLNQRDFSEKENSMES
jgi:hypothetical protein